MQGKMIAKKFNIKCFVFNKVGHQAKNCKNNGQ